jgi:hypothetical protein
MSAKRHQHTGHQIGVLINDRRIAAPYSAESARNVNRYRWRWRCRRVQFGVSVWLCGWLLRRVAQAGEMGEEQFGQASGGA